MTTRVVSSSSQSAAFVAVGLAMLQVIALTHYAKYDDASFKNYQRKEEAAIQRVLAEFVASYPLLAST